MTPSFIIQHAPGSDWPGKYFSSGWARRRSLFLLSLTRRLNCRLIRPSVFESFLRPQRTETCARSSPVQFRQHFPFLVHENVKIHPFLKDSLRLSLVPCTLLCHPYGLCSARLEPQRRIYQNLNPRNRVGVRGNA